MVTEDLKSFIGVVIPIEVYKSANENATQRWSKDGGRPIFKKIMSRARFQQIMKVFRFDDAKEEREIDLRTNFNQSKYNL